MGQSQPIAHAGFRIVVLCEDKSVTEMLRYWLAGSAITAHIARNGYEARSLILADVGGILITDRVLPPWPGLDSLAGLKRNASGIRIATFEDGIRDNRALALFAGADIILSRPLNRAQVISTCQPSSAKSQVRATR